MLKKTAVFLLISLTLLVGCASETPDTSDNGKQPEITASPSETTPDTGATDPGGDDPAPGTTDDTGTNTPGNVDDEVFFFTVRGVEVRMGQPAHEIIEKLGAYNEYFEAPSCAFEGIDKSWYYNGFVVHAYPHGGDDFILSLVLTDDINSTEKRIFIGMTYDNMVAAYGNGYEKSEDQYLYRLGGTSLSFIIRDDIIVAITYRYEDAPAV